MQRLVLSCILVFMAWLGVACSGFEVIQPPDDKILSIRNTTDLSTAEQPNFIPYPMPGLPRTRAPQIESKPYTLRPKSISESPSIGVIPNAVGDVTLADINAEPFDRFAKINFREGPQGYICSSEFVGDSRDVVMTAAHCVYSNDTNTWHNSWRVYPKYDRGSYTTQLNWDCIAIYSGWAKGGYPYDYAFIKVRGQHSAALGLSGNVMPAQWKAAGYPGKYYSSERLVQVEGVNGGSAGGVVKMANNPMGKGASGGAWLTGNTAIGLNSFYYLDDTSSMWGPQFDVSTIALYEFVRQGCINNEVKATSPITANATASRVVVEHGNPPKSMGPEIVYSDTSDCACKESRQATINNKTKNRYIAGYIKSSYRTDALNLGVEKLSVEILPGETRALQCTIENSDIGACTKKNSYSLNALRRIERVSDKTGVQGINTVSPSYCKTMCSEGAPTGYCLPLGSSAQPIVKSLASFISTTLSKQPDGAGIVTTVDDMTRAFDGDPAKVGNPCLRSAFYRKGDVVRNEGIDCRITTMPLDTTPDAMKIALTNPTQTYATRIPDAHDSTKTALAVFSDKQTTPIVEFAGSKADDLNALFGGGIISVEQVATRLVVTTENGCFRGETE